jgi:hypothetical protein
LAASSKSDTSLSPAASRLLGKTIGFVTVNGYEYVGGLHAVNSAKQEITVTNGTLQVCNLPSLYY